jgi:hypothetical protein
MVPIEKSVTNLFQFPAIRFIKNRYFFGVKETSPLSAAVKSRNIPKSI